MISLIKYLVFLFIFISEAAVAASIDILPSPPQDGYLIGTKVQVKIYTIEPVNYKFNIYEPANTPSELDNAYILHDSKQGSIDYLNTEDIDLPSTIYVKLGNWKVDIFISTTQEFSSIPDKSILFSTKTNNRDIFYELEEGFPTSISSIEKKLSPESISKQKLITSTEDESIYKTILFKNYYHPISIKEKTYFTITDKVKEKFPNIISLIPLASIQSNSNKVSGIANGEVYYGSLSEVITKGNIYYSNSVPYHSIPGDYKVQYEITDTDTGVTKFESFNFKIEDKTEPKLFLSDQVSLVTRNSRQEFFGTAEDNGGYYEWVDIGVETISWESTWWGMGGREKVSYTGKASLKDILISEHHAPFSSETVPGKEWRIGSSTDLDFPKLKSGKNYLEIKAIDFSGNIETKDLVIDFINDPPKFKELEFNLIASNAYPYEVNAVAEDDNKNLHSITLEWEGGDQKATEFTNKKSVEETTKFEKKFSYTVKKPETPAERKPVLFWKAIAEDEDGEKSEAIGFSLILYAEAEDNSCSDLRNLKVRWVGDPIDVATGAQFLERNLLSTQGVLGLQFSIRYNSLLLADTGVLGRGWEDGKYNARLETLSDGSALVHWSDNRYNLFKKTETGYQAEHWGCRFDELVADVDGGHTLTRNKQLIYRFDAQGRLYALGNKLNQFIQIQHDEQGRINQVSEPVSGVALTYHYNAQGLLGSVQDNAGKQIELFYDDQQHLIKITDAAQQDTIYTYTAAHQLESETDHEGHQRFHNTYDDQYRIATQDDDVSGNQLLRLQYDDTTQPGYRITTVTDRNGAVRVFTTRRDDFQLTNLQDELGNNVAYQYNENGKLVQITDAKQHVQQRVYHEDGNPNTLDRIVDAEGYSTLLQYDAQENLVRVEDALQQVTQWVYDAENRLTQFIDAKQNTTTYTYNEHNQLASVTKPGQGITLYQYQQGRVSQITGADGQVYQLGYDANGRVSRFTDAENHSTQLVYDGLGRVIQVINPLNASTQLTWNSRNKITSLTDANHNTSTFSYDGNGNLLTQTNALGQTTSFAYDGEDRLIQITDARQNRVQFSYDDKGRLISQTDGLGHTQQFEYDANDNLFKQIDALNQSLGRVEYDARNNPSHITDALDHSTQLHYDVLGRVQQIDEPLERSTQFEYDKLNRLIKSIDALQGESTQNYDVDGNRKDFSDPNQHQTQFDYDNSGRVIGETTTGGGHKTYSWNPLNQLEQLDNGRGQARQFSYDAAGRISEISDPDGTLTYHYDNNGNLLQVDNSQDNSSITRSYDALNRVTSYTDSRGNQLGYAYDEVGNLSSLTYPNGQQVQYGYDANNRLESVTDWDNHSTLYRYDANGRLVETQRANGTIQTRSYDAQGQLKQLKDVDAQGNIIVQYDFGYDAGGDIITETTVPTPDAFALANAELTYTDYNRLLEINGLSPGFDLDGNMTQGALGGALTTFNFDSRNRLSQAGDLQYQYDAENQRISVGDTQYVINSLPELSQTLVKTDPDGSQHYYIYGLGLIGEHTPNKQYRSYHYDLRGSTVALSDETGNITQRFAYSPYGILLQGDASQTPFLFNGLYGVMTDSNGLYYMRARFYNPEIRRFINQDILLGSVADGQSLNRFAYVTGNPVSFVDPFGLAEMLFDDFGIFYGNKYGYGEAGFIARLIGMVVLSTGPAAGEAMDIAVLLDPNAAWWEKGLSGGSLAANSLCPFLPNLGAAILATKTVDPKLLISRQGRNEMSSNKVKKLRRNMRENGYDKTKPVEVADVDGRMIILDGHHRTQGAIGAGIKEIPVDITKVNREQADQLLREAAEARLY